MLYILPLLNTLRQLLRAFLIVLPNFTHPNS